MAERSDAWYGGSGAFDLSGTGYAARRPSSGSFRDDHIGEEVNVTLGWKLPRKFKLNFGYGFFWGGEAAGEVLTVDRDGSWGFFELVWSR